MKQIYKDIYNLHEHSQSAFTKMKCNVGLKCKLKCQSWDHEKNNLTPINEKQKIKSWNIINKTKQSQKHQQKNSQKKKTKPQKNWIKNLP
jgi:hypothetical protein